MICSFSFFPLDWSFCHWISLSLRPSSLWRCVIHWIRVTGVISLGLCLHFLVTEWASLSACLDGKVLYFVVLPTCYISTHMSSLIYIIILNCVQFQVFDSLEVTFRIPHFVHLQKSQILCAYLGLIQFFWNSRNSWQVWELSSVFGFLTWTPIVESIFKNMLDEWQLLRFLWLLRFCFKIVLL